MGLLSKGNKQKAKFTKWQISHDFIQVELTVQSKSNRRDNHCEALTHFHNAS